MPNATEKKKASIRSAVGIIGVLLFFLAMLFCLLFWIPDDAWVAVGFLAFYGVILLTVIAGVLIALRQRLREIKSGEEEEAKKY